MHHLTIFDLDHTLLPGDSDYLWGQFVLEEGLVPANWQQEIAKFARDYRLRKLNIQEYITFCSQPIVGKDEAYLSALHKKFMFDKILPLMRPEAQQLVDTHRSNGDELLVITATNRYITQPIISLFGIDQAIATDLARDDLGYYNGQIEGVAALGVGKVVRLTKWLTERNTRLEDLYTTFYSDSCNDLPLLEKVNRPVATNPDAELRSIAVGRNWEVIDLWHPSKRLLHHRLVPLDELPKYKA
ncbi:MAG: HAD family hydrolase [Gammaproteobacteria bacterium]|nr:HAD family hydrolase [Gammaproteobacteria bacterium]